MDEKEKQIATKILDRVYNLADAQNESQYDGLHQFIYDELKAIQVQALVSPTEPTFTKALVLESVRKEITESYKSEMSKTDFDNKLYTILGIINCALP